MSQTRLMKSTILHICNTFRAITGIGTSTLVLTADIDTPPDSNVGLIRDYFVRFTWHVVEGVTYPYLHIGIGADPPVPGDLDGDCDVDFDDFEIFANNWLGGVE